MPAILRTTLIQDLAIAPSVQVQRDLPVNPLSHLLVTLSALNNTPANAAHNVYAGLLQMIARLSVTYRGASIVAGRLIDLAFANALLSHWLPRLGQAGAVDNDVRSITVPICFGRRPFNPTECFPATRRGDLVLTLDPAAALPAGLDGFALQVETVELLDAAPEAFTKITETQRTMQAGDQNEIALPIGNRLLGILLNAATFPTAAALDSSFGSIALELDNVEVIYSRANWLSLYGDMLRRMRTEWPMRTHTHKENVAAAYAQFAQTREQETDDAVLQAYAYLDLDPLEDLTYTIDTANAADFNIQVTSDVADGAVSRVLPIERVMIAGAAGAPA